MIEFNIEKNIVEKRRAPDLMPLIDMIFILLVFFLLTSTAFQPAVDVALPESSSSNPKITPSIVVTIQTNGILLINEERVSDEMFLPVLNSRYRGQSDSDLTIQADRRVAFGRVVEIMDLCKRAGVEEISFLVEMEAKE